MYNFSDVEMNNSIQNILDDHNHTQVRIIHKSEKRVLSHDFPVTLPQIITNPTSQDSTWRDSTGESQRLSRVGNSTDNSKCNYNCVSAPAVKAMARRSSNNRQFVLIMQQRR